MNVELNRIDDLNVEVNVRIAPEDYAENKKKKLNAFRRNADLKGFRRGMAPMSLIERLYGDRALADALNEQLGEALDKAVKDNGLHLLGEPIPAENQPEHELQDGNTFDYVFRMGLRPEMDFEVGKDDVLNYYKIRVTEAAKKEMKENMLRQFGSMQDTDKAGEDDFLTADLVQGETRIEDTYIRIRSIAEAVRPAFVGIKAGDTLDVNVNEAFTDEADRAAMLKVKREELASMDPEWKLTVKSVKTFAPAKPGPEAYDKMFGEGVVKTAEEFDAKVAERLEANYREEADFRLKQDLRPYLVAKAGGVKLPEDFLRRWIFISNEGKFTEEQIDKDFPQFIEGFRWSLVRDYLVGKLGIKVEKSDLEEEAARYVAYQYAMYGMSNLPENIIKDAVQRMLADERQARNLFDTVQDEKVLEAVRPLVTLKDKSITVEKFRELK